MFASILATKLHVPTFREKVVIRSRLLNQLSAGLSGKMTLISASAGFGKTTLISYWVSQLNRSVAWLSLDETDNDPRQFWTYFIATLHTVEPKIGEGELELLRSPQPPSMNQFLTTLINKLDRIQNRFVFVLDDYHVIQSAEINRALTFLLDHLPTPMHLVVITREVPSLPLVRLRARHQLTELHAADLRFTNTEATDFLNEVMALNLSSKDIAILEKRTEGWITGLQLAAISLQRHPDVSQFIQSFAGSHRFVLDYLMEEVLQQQPKSVQSFLLYTCILDRLCGSLCDAVLLGSLGDTTLEYLERANLLIIPLDHQREWYRYHHLFADALRTRLMKVDPSKVPELHLRACEWYEQQGLPADAIRHAFAAHDYERAAGLIEQTWQAMRRIRQEATLLTWMKALPDELIHLSPD